MRRNIWFICCLWLGLCTKVLGQVIELKPYQKTYTIGKWVHVLEDASGQLTLEDVLSDVQASKFKLSTQENLNFGFSQKTYWLKFQVSDTQPNRSNWFWILSYPNLDHVDFYYQDDKGEWQVKNLGDEQPFARREIFHRYFILPLQLHDDLPHVYYLRIATTSSVQIPMSIYNEEFFYEEDAKAEMLYGLFYGMMLIMVLYNLFVAASMKERNYLFYVFSIIGSTIFFAAVNGHLYQYVLFDFPRVQSIMIPFGIGIWITFSAYFTKYFLHTKQVTRLINTLLKGIIGVGILITVCSTFVPYMIMVRFAAAFVGVNVIILVSAGIVTWLRGDQAARFFVFAWVFLLGGAFLIVVSRFGALPNNFLTNHGVEIGAALQVLLLSFALTDRYKLIEQENKLVQEEALKVQKEANENLEKKVEQRTEEINAQKQEIEAQRDNLEQQKHLLAKKNDSIMSSINYAKRIQQAMLPQPDKIAQALPNHFIFFKPKDVVSGDFYFFQEIDRKVILAVIDCTGHGVPGALMSMLGYNLLSNIISEHQTTQASKILNELHRGIRAALKQEETHNKDGMEVALCILDFADKTLTFAGAGGSELCYVQNFEMHTLRGDKHHIGGERNDDNLAFQQHTISVAQPTMFYIYSDGFQDQFGGEEGRKFMPNHFKQLLLKMSHKHILEQRSILERMLENWMGEKHKQVDDILVIGVQLK